LRRVVPGILLLLLGAAGCSTADSIFPRTGTLKVQPLDLTLSTQSSAEPSNQFLEWTVAKAEADIPGLGTVNLLTERDGVAGCFQVQQIFSLNSAAQAPGATCRAELSGLSLEAGTAGSATVRLEVSDLWVTRAERPALADGADFDQDGVPDETDNCPYVANPGQENGNAGSEGENPVGNACTNANGVKDSDADGVADTSDNCVYVANPDQVSFPGTAGFYDTVGTACREQVHVTLPGTTLVIRRTDVPFTIRDGGVTYLNLDFRSKDWCQTGTSCAIQPEDVVLNVQ
jgi:hypothetical protein